MTNTNLNNLLLRVEGASGPDEELDTILAVDLTGWCLHPLDRQRDDSCQSDSGYTCLDCGADSWGNTGPSGQKRHAAVPAYTASLDAALALVERTASPTFISISNTFGTWHAEVGEATASAKTAPIALLAALLHALKDNSDER